VQKIEHGYTRLDLIILSSRRLPHRIVNRSTRKKMTAIPNETTETMSSGGASRSPVIVAATRNLVYDVPEKIQCIVLKCVAERAVVRRSAANLLHV